MSITKIPNIITKIFVQGLVQTFRAEEGLEEAEEGISGKVIKKKPREPPRGLNQTPSNQHIRSQ
jgi:hypothetical protein